jgi:hypothetical protein
VKGVEHAAACLFDLANAVDWALMTGRASDWNVVALHARDVADAISGLYVEVPALPQYDFEKWLDDAVDPGTPWD